MGKMQESELAAMDWFHMSEIEAMPIFSQGVFKSVLQCCKAYIEGQHTGFSRTVLPNFFTKRPELLLHSGHVQ